MSADYPLNQLSLSKTKRTEAAVTYRVPAARSDRRSQFVRVPTDYYPEFPVQWRTSIYMHIYASPFCIIFEITKKHIYANPREMIVL